MAKCMLRSLAFLALLSIWMAVPSNAHAQASELITSYAKISNGAFQPFRCSNNQATPSPDLGEDCEVGDWSQAFNGSGARFLKVWWRVSAGTGKLVVWECNEFYGASMPANNPRPSTTPGASGTSPLCVNLTAGSGVILDGLSTGVQYFQTVREYGGFGFIAVELETESGLTANMRLELR